MAIVNADATALLPGIDVHPHARAVLAPALSSHRPSHAYLFHGPSGTGKRAIAREFAAALLIDGARDPGGVAERVARGSHPDLSWVTPSGAAEMLVSDIEEPVVAAATRTPFESLRRVFVIEAVETMNDQTANRMLKTLEEPPDFVHLLLLTDRREDVLETIASRCQPVRFDAIPAARIAERLLDAEPERAEACARLALGDARRAAWLAGEQGGALRASAECFVRAALAGASDQRPWTRLLEVAKSAGVSAGERAQEEMARELELVPAKEHKRHEREGLEARRRRERRERTRTLDLGLGLAELWLRDLLCVREGVPELIHAIDRRTSLLQDGTDATDLRLCAAIELVQDTRLRLPLHVSEELALEGLAYRLGELRRFAVSVAGRGQPSGPRLGSRP